MTTFDFTAYSLPDEFWRPIPGYENVYAASNLGRIIRVADNIGKNGGKGRAHAGTIVRELSHARGYTRVNLKHNRTVKQYFVHRLIALAFFGPCPEKMEVNHKNGIKNDNRIENLEYVTHIENEFHKRHVLKKQAKDPNAKSNYRKGYRDPGLCKGATHPKAKLTDDDVREIRRLREAGLLHWEIAEKFGISDRQVSAIVRRENWKHVE